MNKKANGASNQNHQATVLRYLDCLKEVVVKRMQSYFAAEPQPYSVKEVPLPKIERGASAFTEFVLNNKLKEEEIITLLIAIAPHIDAVFFDTIIYQFISGKTDFPQIGGVRGKNSRSFLPTGDTVLFILSGSDVQERLRCFSLFDGDHLFNKMGVLWLEEVAPGDPVTSGKLILSPDYLELFVKGKVSYPKLSMEFPAQHVTTEMQWEDLVLNTQTRKQIEELEIWIKYNERLMDEWGMSKKIKPGYRVLFYGPPGTGKTLAATLLGKYTQKEVFRIDLSMVVSKFIGETEKNLSRLFDKAENKNWILFFDEADALFSKRTQVRDAHDKYANQEAAYLLQRIEQFNGLVILATNFKTNIDEAFIRRFQSVVHFPAPTVSERLALWEKSFPQHLTLHKTIQLPVIAKKYELTGSTILNVVQHCCLQALNANQTCVTEEVILSGIKKELLKEGKIWQE